MGASLYSLHVPSGFAGRAGSDLSLRHVFLQGVLAALTLVGSGTGDGGARAGARCDSGLLLCLVTITAPLGSGGSFLVAGAEAARVRSETALFPPRVCFPLSHHHHPCPRGEQCWNKRAWSGCSVWVKVQAVVFLAPLEFWEAPTLLPPGVTAMATVPPLRCCARSKAAPSPHNRAPPPLAVAVLAVVWSCTTEPAGWSRCSTWAGEPAGMATGNQPESWVAFICSLRLVLGVSECAHTLHKQTRGFLQPRCQGHWSANQLRGLILLTSDPRAGAPKMWFKPLASQGGSLRPCNPPSLLCPPLWAQVPT